MAPRIEYDEERAVPALAEGLRSYWRDFVAERPDEHVYGVGFHDSFEHGHADVTVFTEEGLARMAASYGDEPVALRWTGTPYLLSRPDLVDPVVPPDSTYEAYRSEIDRQTGSVGFPGVLDQEQLDEAWNSIVGDDDDPLADDSAWDEPCEEYLARVRRNCKRALRLVADEGLFGDRLATITLLVTSDGVEADLGTVRRINPPEVAERFAAELRAAGR